MILPSALHRGRVPALFVACILLSAVPPARAQAPSPESFFGFRMGADGQVADWPAIERYFAKVAATSSRVRLIDAGTTTEGRHLTGAIVSAAENIERLEAIREANQRLADPRWLAPEEAARLAADHKVVVAIGASIHASELGATQAANELLYELASSTDARILSILRDVVVIVLPSLNPDGHAIVVDWIAKTKGTPFDGAPLPWLYHKYAGHDINRDAFMMNLAESRSLAHFFYAQWHPQVFLAMHQMDPDGPRMFVPPNYEPVNANYDPLIWREAAVLGQAMALELERHDRAGVISNALFDYYWPGYEDSAPLGHNTVCLLSEVAGARMALPREVKARELTAGDAGFPEYAPQVTFPNPWPGGTWRLRDIVDYEIDAVHGLLAAAALYRREILEDFYRMGRRAIERGRSSPFAFVVSPEQRDQNAASRLVDLLIDGSVEVQQAQEPFRVGDSAYPAGTAIVLMSQPYRAYAKTLLERQDYPVRRPVKGSPPERPYDVAGWTLPLQMGVKVDRVEQPFELPVVSRLARASIPPAPLWGDKRASFYVLDAPGTAGAIALGRLLDAGLDAAWLTSPIEYNGFRYPAGSIVVGNARMARETVTALARDLGLRADGVRGKRPTSAMTPIGRARVGIYRPWSPNTDEGWTRFVLDQYRIPFRNLASAEIRKGGLRTDFDVIVLPDASPRDLLDGPQPGSLPPEFSAGLGDAGIAALKAFVEAGGTLVCLDSSGQIAIDALKLPVKDAVAGLPPQDFFCPGSLVRLEVEANQPASYGVAADAAALFANGAAYEVDWSKPGAEGVTTVARYAAKDILLSGWLEGEGRMAGRGALVQVRSGRGRVLLTGIRPQHRAQSLATFRFLLNAMFTAAATVPAANQPHVVR